MHKFGPTLVAIIILIIAAFAVCIAFGWNDLPR